MTGTFGGALEARGIPADSGKLYSESVGELEKDRGVLVIKRVHVSYVLNVSSELISEKKNAIQRAFNLHPESCPVYKSIHKSINITKELEIVEADGS